MKNIELVGSLMIILGIIVISGYLLYIFVQESEIPASIRVGTTAIVIGILVILLSLIRERLIDWMEEKTKKL